jgi:hypothetical protein
MGAFDGEKEAMMAQMDAAAIKAEAQLKSLSQHLTVPIARWFFENYLAAGHKRLGRILVAHAKAMNGTTAKDWANADEVE